MKDLRISLKGNYSKVGKFTAQKFSYVLDKSSHADKVLKDKPRKKIIEKSYLEKLDNENEDKDDDKEFSIDIFDKDYKNKYNDLLEAQKIKYFDYTRSCAMNKKFNLEENKINSENEKRYRYHILHHNQLENKKDSDNELKLIFLDQNISKHYNLHKIAYSQSFYKMIGRDDKEKTKEKIENKLREKNPNKKNKTFEFILNSSIKKNNKKKKKNLKSYIRGVGMDKQLQRGILPEHHDVRIRTAKCLDIESSIINNKFIRNIYSSLPSSLLINKNLNFLKDKKKISRIFSSSLPNNKNNLLINDKNKNDNKNETIEKRIFSGFNSMKNISIKSHPKSSLTNKTKDQQFNSDSSNNNKTMSLYDFNKIKRKIYSEKNKSYSYLNKNKSNKYNKERLFSTPVHNKAVSFKKMLSRQYVNRVKINDKIGAGLPLTPNYNMIYPKIVMNVMYRNKHNFSKKKEFKGLVGEYLSEINKNINKYNTLQQYSNFEKMFGRGTNTNSKFPIFMNNINTRNVFDFCTEKSLKMNHFSSGKLNNPFSSFNLRKSFNNIISNKNQDKNNSVDNKNNNKHKESRLDYYNNNLDNIFKKVIYDNIVDNNIDNNENKNKENEALLDLKKNPQLAKTINLSYKNLISDYYRLNLDYLNKDSVQDKVDGVTFEIIKKDKPK